VANNALLDFNSTFVSVLLFFVMSTVSGYYNFLIVAILFV